MARKAALDFLKSATGEEGPPAPSRAHQWPRHRHDRRRSRRHRAGRAGRHFVSQGRRRRDRHPCRRQADRARGHRRLAGRRDQDSGADGGIGRRPVHRRHLQKLQRAADRHDLGAGGSVRRARRRGQPRGRRRAHRALSHRARHVPLRRGGGEGAGDRDHPRRFPQRRRAAQGHRDRAPRRLCRAARHPSGAGAGDQRGVHAVARRRSKRPRPSSPPLRHSPAPAPSASTARCTTARIWCGPRRCWSG